MAHSGKKDFEDDPRIPRYHRSVAIYTYYQGNDCREQHAPLQRTPPITNYYPLFRGDKL